MTTDQLEIDLCPKCGSEVTRDSVDIGVGIQVGPARCDSCGWTQDLEINKLFKEQGIPND